MPKIRRGGLEDRKRRGEEREFWREKLRREGYWRREKEEREAGRPKR